MVEDNGELIIVLLTQHGAVADLYQLKSLSLKVKFGFPNFIA